ncbi:hypothetical protein D9757_009710 [Collybiopsis confluens]|uniref:Mitochondrial import inner membrane translocase subunit TIM50 n=1 Tax=Collybiopsis confluens TaxID=2823264 RepID=A0A8H5H5M7_9AGAR|nr:hypothetical protein D9757_009710 [Collybiopsis confluens]
MYLALLELAGGRDLVEKHRAGISRGPEKKKKRKCRVGSLFPVMLSAVSRTVSRRAVAQSTRCMAKKSTNSSRSSSDTPPTPPPPSAAAESTSKSAPSSSSSPEPKETTGLPDLTRPSVLSLDFSPPDPAEQRTGASSRDKLSSADHQRRAFARVAFGMLALGVGMNVAYMGREWDAEELKEKKLTLENAPAGRWERTGARYKDMFDYFSNPPTTELLPPRAPPHPQAPIKNYTLLIDIDDLLVTSTWDRQHGWRTAKRPGADYFLAYISQFYELVVFTTQYSYTAHPVLDKLDRYNFYIEHRLTREHTRAVNGQPVKDLSFLNRDLSKVIVLDTDIDHVSLHPENAVIIPKWKGDPKDNGLVAIIPFLESIAIYKPSDVRPIVSVYHGKDISTEYAKLEAEGKQKHIENWKQNKGSRSNSFGSFFGVSSRSTHNAPPTYLEQKRKEAQQQYLDEQAQIAKNKDYLESLLEHEQAVLAASQPNNVWEAIEAFKGNPKQVDLESVTLPPMPAPPPGMVVNAPPVPSSPAPTSTSTQQQQGSTSAATSK